MSRGEDAHQWYPHPKKETCEPVLHEAWEEGGESGISVKDLCENEMGERLKNICCAKLSKRQGVTTASGYTGKRC